MSRNKGVFLHLRHESLVPELRCRETRGVFLQRGGGIFARIPTDSVPKQDTSPILSPLETDKMHAIVQNTKSIVQNCDFQNLHGQIWTISVLAEALGERFSSGKVVVGTPVTSEQHTIWVSQNTVIIKQCQILHL